MKIRDGMFPALVRGPARKVKYLYLSGTGWRWRDSVKRGRVQTGALLLLIRGQIASKEGTQHSTAHLPVVSTKSTSMDTTQCHVDVSII